MIMMPYYYYLFGKTLYFSWSHINWLQRLAGTVIIIISCLLYMLHIIWFKQIAIGIGKAFGCIKKKNKPVAINEEYSELV